MGLTYAITGGTGSLGTALVERLLADQSVERVVVLSRDEVKQSALATAHPDPRLRCFLGDVRDVERCRQAFRGVDTVIHAAALKRVETSTYSPFELVQTNILGTVNVIQAAAAERVRRVVVVSSDKACQATNLYGGTKFVAEGCAVQANSYTYPRGTSVVAVRYGNVFGSRGSVVHVWRGQVQKEEPATITDFRMTRFWMTLPEAVDLVLTAADESVPAGRVIIPKLPSFRVEHLLHAVVPDGWPVHVTGLRPGGEKLHESLLSEEEIWRTEDHGSVYEIRPSFQTWCAPEREGMALPRDFQYASHVNSEWLTVDELRTYVSKL